ncbi:hypothetical protein BS78_01G241700 [Paspalum vaginatum]|nr:hypothetical protein BS78_01G241700 [Paspalum vaginatum]
MTNIRTGPHGGYTQSKAVHMAGWEPYDTCPNLVAALCEVNGALSQLCLPFSHLFVRLRCCVGRYAGRLRKDQVTCTVVALQYMDGSCDSGKLSHLAIGFVL